jgi:hypothetical protein
VQGRAVHVIPRVPPPLEVGVKWGFWGDSQTGGRDTGIWKSHVEAWCTIWARKFPTKAPSNPINGLDTNPFRNGVSGRSLGGTRDHYNAAGARTDRDWVHAQESGGQNTGDASQVTVEAFVLTYLNFWRGVHANTPNARKTYETAFSFGRESILDPDYPFRDWTTRNAALVAANAILYQEGIEVLLVHTDFFIKAVQSELGAAALWFQSGEENEFHYRGLGNLVVACAICKALRIPLTQLDLADFTGATYAQKQVILDKLTLTPEI